MPFTTKTWDGSAGRWPDAASYCKACLVDNNPAGAEKTKAQCHFPVKEPDGTYNVNALRAVLGGRGAQADFPGAAAARARARALFEEWQSSQGNRTGFLERRSAELVDSQLDGSSFRGYAAVFNEPWDPKLTEAQGYEETIARGAFRKALSRSENIPLLWQHDQNSLLATTDAGTLKLTEDGKGLYVEADLPDTTLGRDVREHIARGEIRGMSFGMETQRGDSITSKQSGRWQRTIANIQRLLDVTLTWNPAYTGTSVELRAAHFVWAPLQELVDGDGTQIDDAAAEVTSQQTGDPGSRARELIIQELAREVSPL